MKFCEYYYDKHCDKYNEKCIKQCYHDMSTQEAIEYLNKMFQRADFADDYGDYVDTDPYEEALNMAIDALTHNDWDEVPNCIEMEGEWIYGNGNGECSICGREKQYGWDNYCGYCGAKMEG